MTSTCKTVVQSLSFLGSKLAANMALYDGKPLGSPGQIYRRLNEQVQEILLNFRFSLPLSDCLNKWIVTKDENLQSLVIEIHTTIDEAAKMMKPEDVDFVLQDICEMAEETGWQAIEETAFLLIKSLINAPRRALKLFCILYEVNAKIHLLKPKIEMLCCMALSHGTHISHTLPYKIFSCKEFGFEWLVATTCSCLLEIKPEAIGHSNHLEVLELRRNLLNLQIFLSGLSEIPGIDDITNKVAYVAVHALLLACLWWVHVHGESKTRLDIVFIDALLHQRKRISPGDIETQVQVFKLLKSLESIDHSLFIEKIIEFSKYILPCLVGPVEFTREIGTSTIMISTQIQRKSQELQSMLTFMPNFRQLILDIEISFSCWLPEGGPLMMNLLANVCLLMVETICIQRIRDRGRFKHPFKISGKWKFKYSIEWPEKGGENINQIMKLLDEVALLQDIPDHCFPSPETVLECSVLLKVQIFKLKRELESYNGNSKFSLKEKVQSFQEWSEFLIDYFIRYRENTEQYNKACCKYEVEIESMVEMVLSSCNSFLNHYPISDEMVQSVDHIFSSFLDDIKNIMARIAEELWIPARMSNLPKTNALGFHDILLEKIHELMKCKDSVFISFKQYIEELLLHLHFFRNFLHNYSGAERKTQELRNLCVLILRVAYEVEYLIDSILFSAISLWKISICLYNLLLDMRHIKRQISEINEKKVYDVHVHTIPQSLKHKVLRASTSQVDDTVQSLKDEQNLIIDRLVGGYLQRDIVLIVGMPGIGKTTLAKQVYNCWTVEHHFHIRAWCCVGEVYRKRELLLEILSCMIVLTENIRGKSGEDLESKLRQLLLKQKYLIVIDDMWSTEAWNDLQTSLPENENGSRVLITSRSCHVGLKVEPHYLRLLSDAESWALLQMKIFGEECCPEVLIDIGQEIAKNCKGLPLAVVAMAGILKRIDKQENLWKNFAKHLSSQVVDDPHEQCRDILELSYKFLPEHLKPCFLHFGAFPEDEEIPVTRLIRLWIAEGLVEKTEMKSLEKLAEDYLEDLIGRYSLNQSLEVDLKHAVCMTCYDIFAG